MSEGQDGAVLLNCHAGCSTEAVVAALDLEMRDLFPPKPKAKPVKEIVCEYTYTDENGEPLFQTVRYRPKDFRQRHPNGDGWAWNLNGVRRVLYRLPDVRQAVTRGKWVVFVEGEKDADRLAREGVCATTSPMGAKSWRDEYADLLEGAKVAVIPDPDGPGRAHAAAVVSALAGKASEVRVVDLDADASDWLDAGNTVDELKRRILDWQPAKPGIADAFVANLDRYVAFSEVQRDTVVLWILHAWTIRAHYTTPRLLITSPERECGKSVLMDVMREMLDNKRDATAATGATLWRSMEAEPAYFMDELDQTLTQDNDRTRDVVAVLNTGYRRGASVPRCVGKDYKVTDFATFAPIVFSGIEAKLDGPFMSRTIPIRMTRATPSERFKVNRKIAQHFEELRGWCRQWVEGATVGMMNAEPELPEGLEGRPAELWEPLLAVADQLGGDWPARARHACKALTLWKAPEDDSPSHRILVACQEIWGDDDTLATSVMAERLNNLEDEDFGRWSRGNGLSSKMLTTHLSKYGIEQYRNKRERGYRRSDFALPWATYCIKRDEEAVENGGDPLSPSLFSISVTTAGQGTNGVTDTPSQVTDRGPAVTDKPVDMTDDASVTAGPDLSLTDDHPSPNGSDPSPDSADLSPVTDLYGGLAGPNDPSRFAH